MQTGLFIVAFIKTFLVLQLPGVNAAIVDETDVFMLAQLSNMSAGR